MKIIENKLFKQIIRFGIIGGLAFLIDYALLYICTDIIGIHYLISSIISFTVSVIFNYILSIKWVFEVDERTDPKRNFLLFIIFSVIGLGINEVIMYVGVTMWEIYYMLVKIFATFIVMIFNFITRKIFLEN